MYGYRVLEDNVEEAVIKKVQPHSIEAEQTVIGSMLMNRDVIADVSAILTKEDFYQRQYGEVYHAMVLLYNEGRPVELVPLKEKLKSLGLPESISNLEFMKEVIMAVPTSVSVMEYARIVQDYAVKRRLIQFSETLSNACYVGKDSVDALLEDTEKQIFQIVQEHRGMTEEVPIKQVVMNVLDRIEAAAKSGGRITGVPTGFTQLDYKLSGMHPSELILVAARPAMGKTAFVLNIAQNVVGKSNIPCAIFSLEMDKEQLVSRLIAMDSMVDSSNIRTGDLTGGEWKDVMESAITIGEAPLYIDDTSGITITELRSKCRKLKMRNEKLGLIIIDYLQLMGGGRRSESRQQEISEISRSLKVLARELRVPIIALSQLSRAVESRDDKKPMLSDLRESGAIEQDADVVMFIYREDYYLKEESTRPGMADIIIAKQRNGATGTVELVWLGQYTKFANPERKRTD